MRYLIAVLLMIFSNTQALAQQFEIGPFVGGANYVGDVGSTDYINPSSLFAGGILKYNASTRHSFRFSMAHTRLKANDINSKDLRRQQRGYSFSTGLTEISAGLEFTFWEFNLTRNDNHGTPYLFTGVNYYFADRLEAFSGGIAEKDGKTGGFSIPISLGYKRKLNSFLAGGIEIGARYALTDNLDGSHIGDFNFGNPNTNDWYVFTGVYITFYFSKRACFNDFE